MADLICSICLDAPQNAVSIPCGHVYCKVCIDAHIGSGDCLARSSCPQCRKDFCADIQPNTDGIPHRCLLPALRPVYFSRADSQSGLGSPSSSGALSFDFDLNSASAPSMRTLEEWRTQPEAAPIRLTLKRFHAANARLQRRTTRAARLLQKIGYLWVWWVLAPRIGFLISWLHWSILKPLCFGSSCAFWFSFVQAAYTSLVIAFGMDEEVYEEVEARAKERLEARERCVGLNPGSHPNHDSRHPHVRDFSGESTLRDRLIDEIAREVAERMLAEDTAPERGGRATRGRRRRRN